MRVYTDGMVLLKAHNVINEIGGAMTAENPPETSKEAS